MAHTFEARGILPASVREQALALLDANWREGEQDGVPYGFSVPSPSTYPWQWYCDSCMHAIVRSRSQPDRARTELQTLLAASREGFIGHTVFWGHRLHRRKRFRYNVVRRGDHATSTIQPPMLAWAWRAAVGEPAENSAIAEHHRWLRDNRALEDDGLLWLVQPDESGLDASPKFDHVWGPCAQGTPLFPALVARNRRLGFDVRRVQSAGRPLVCEVLTNVIWSLSEQALGRPSLTPALIERCYDPALGRFCDDVRNPHRECPRERVPLTWDTLAPLALPDLPEDIGHRLVRQFLISGVFADSSCPLVAVAVGDRSYSLRERFWGFRRHWRGHAWMNTLWLVGLGLRRLGYDCLADTHATRVGGLVAREGFREYYHARTGRGLAARDFGWSTLLCEMNDPSPGSLTSFLPAPGAAA